MNRKLLCLLLLMLISTTCLAQENAPVKISDSGQAITVKIGSNVFTTYDYSTYKKPIFYPIFGPKQISMTRNFPMVKNVDGEADDHPHHKSMWLGHEINEIDFWTEKGGSVKLTDREIKKSGFTAEHHWINDEINQVVMKDNLEVRFGSNDNFRYIDYKIEFFANKNAVVFKDTKEGTFAIRVHPQLRSSPDRKRGASSVSGRMKNSNGTTGKKIWGQKARWVSYAGTIDRQQCGIAVFDHPSNLRHPTTWHARDYGLFAANPFGIHYFAKQKKGAGRFELKPGKSLRLWYRVVFHLNEWNDQRIEKEFRAFAANQ